METNNSVSVAGFEKSKLVIAVVIFEMVVALVCFYLLGGLRSIVYLLTHPGEGEVGSLLGLLPLLVIIFSLFILFTKNRTAYRIFMGINLVLAALLVLAMILLIGLAAAFSN